MAQLSVHCVVHKFKTYIDEVGGGCLDIKSVMVHKYQWFFHASVFKSRDQLVAQMKHIFQENLEDSA